MTPTGSRLPGLGASGSARLSALHQWRIATLRGKLIPGPFAEIMLDHKDTHRPGVVPLSEHECPSHDAFKATRFRRDRLALLTTELFSIPALRRPRSHVQDRTRRIRS